jgi:hypothetical protein
MHGAAATLNSRGRDEGCLHGPNGAASSACPCEQSGLRCIGHDDRRYNRPDRLIDGYARHASKLSDLPPGAHNDGVIGLSSHLRCCRHSMGGLKILEIP